MLLMFIGCLAGQRTEMRTEAYGHSISAVMGGWTDFESGDPILEGSRFCLSLDMKSCADTSSASRIFGSSDCYEMQGLGEHVVSFEPEAPEGVDCSEGLPGPDQIRFEAVSASDLRAQLRWPVEEYFVTKVEGSESAELLGPDFFFEGLLPPVDAPLRFGEGANIYLSAQLFDAEDEEVEWSQPWKMHVSDSERPNWIHDEGRAVGSVGGAITLDGPQGQSLELGSWSPWREEEGAEARLHVLVGEGEPAPGSEPAGFAFAWMELGGEGQVIRQGDTKWGLVGAPGFKVIDKGQPGLASIEPDYCARDIESRKERLTVVAKAGGRTKRQRLTFPLGGIGENPDDWAVYERICGVPPQRKRRGCSSGGSPNSAPGWGLLAGGLLLLRGRRSKA